MAGSRARTRSKGQRKAKAKERAMKTRRVDTKELGLIESGSENAEKSWLGIIVGFVAINQFSMDSVTSLHVCPKSYATHATLSVKVWGMREVVCNEMDLHGEVCTRRPMLSIIWWEIEGFHLTVGDGCRKLGGHGRQIILRRNGDSHLVNVEFKDGLLGCKKSTLRDVTGLVTHANSGVLGCSAPAFVDERRVASSTIELHRCEAVESQKSAQVPVAPLCCACIVGRSREAPQPLHLGGDEAVTATMPVVSLDDFSLTLTDNTTGEGNAPTIVHTTYNPGFMVPILTECVWAHGAMGEFLIKFPDRKNLTFEETDGGLDRSHESLGAAFNTKEKGKHTVDDCAMYCGDWNGLQRHRHGVHVWPDGAQEEDQWEYDIAPKKGLVPCAVRGVYASLQELSYLRMVDPQE